MLKLSDLKLSIGASRILNGISFEIASGETVGIIGPNGSGKTTLFNAISGFVSATSGQILLKGGDITDAPAFARASLGMARVFQNFGVFREMTVLENIVVALESSKREVLNLLPWSKAHFDNIAQAKSWLDQVGLLGKAKDKTSSLSGGQMRLLEIVRAMAYGADLFLLDEPTAGVSPKMKDDVTKLIVKLKELGKTILIIEHDLNFIQKFCGRIIVLDQGLVVMDDAPDKVRESSMLQEIYFGAQSVGRPG